MLKATSAGMDQGERRNLYSKGSELSNKRA